MSTFQKSSSQTGPSNRDLSPKKQSIFSLFPRIYVDMTKRPFFPTKFLTIPIHVKLISLYQMRQIKALAEQSSYIAIQFSISNQMIKRKDCWRFCSHINWRQAVRDYYSAFAMTRARDSPGGNVYNKNYRQRFCGQCCTGLEIFGGRT